MKTKYIVFPLLLILVVTAGYFAVGRFSRQMKVAQPLPPQSREVAGSVAPEDLVYVATSGGDVVYHQARCPELGGGGRPLAIAEALKQGYKPCPRCIINQSRQDK